MITIDTDIGTAKAAFSLYLKSLERAKTANAVKFGHNSPAVSGLADEITKIEQAFASIKDTGK